jgi:hypothetical protein
MAARSFIAGTVLVLGACSPPDSARESDGAEPDAMPATRASASTADEVGEPPEVAATAAATPAATATTIEAGARALSEETDLYLFKQAWPEAVGAIPKLAARLDREGAAARRELALQAERDQDEAEDSGFPFNKYSLNQKWSVVANLPGWLSLANDFSTFSGGAHGMYGRQSLVWDKKAGVGRKGIDLFASPAVLGEALGDRLCEALDAERLRRRGPEYLPDPDDPFGACPGVDEATVLVGSSNGRTFNRIELYFGPYVAGPYAEGAFELRFPVDAEVLDAVKPDYRSAFSIRR